MVDITPSSHDGPDFGWALFQLMAQKIDSRAGARAADMTATLAFLAGRVIQRATFREQPQDFVIDRSANGVTIVRNDAVSRRISLLTPGTLASTLVEAAMLAGARRFPEISRVAFEAQEAMHRRGAAELRGAELSASPQDLAQHAQADIDALLCDSGNRSALVRASIQACGFAVGYNRARLCPAEAAELALSVALHASWTDQRGAVRPHA